MVSLPSLNFSSVAVDTEGYSEGLAEHPFLCTHALNLSVNHKFRDNLNFVCPWWLIPVFFFGFFLSFLDLEITSMRIGSAVFLRVVRLTNLPQVLPALNEGGCGSCFLGITTNHQHFIWSQRFVYIKFSEMLPNLIFLIFPDSVGVI